MAIDPALLAALQQRSSSVQPGADAASTYVGDMQMPQEQPPAELVAQALMQAGGNGGGGGAQLQAPTGQMSAGGQAPMLRGLNGPAMLMPQQQMAATGPQAPVQAQGMPPMPRPRPTPPASVQPTSYTIGKGDTASAIAKAHGISLAALLAANPQIKNANKIYVGHKLAIPGRA